MRGGVTLVADTATGLDRERRTLQLASGRAVPWDRVSFNVGSRVAPMAAPTPDPKLWPAKPIAGLADLRARLEQRFARAEPTPIVVVGAGATGCELAANLLALARRCRHRAAVTLVGAGERILPEGPPGAAAALAAHLERHGARIRAATRAEAIEADGVRLADGHEPAEHVVLATGLEADPLVQSLGLPADRARRAARRRAAALDRRPARLRRRRLRRLRAAPAAARRRVRRCAQAPVLLGNLAAALAGREGRPFRPQRQWLAILDLGDGRALALRGRRWALGRWPRRLKERLDRGFVGTFRM
ncbi:MAG: FAD-dependent oxidoreductase [Halofilum sp. (in: g-proteobacteria)]|nr:FAD-dependent oxidoreductase [Halofilum sp. (in: g-proteobacteria)]